MLYLLCIAWLITTVATALWWMYLGLQFSGVQEHDYRFMFIVEGIVFIALIIGGGIGLILALRNSQKKSLALEDFLRTLSHEIKHAMTNIRLQAGLLTDSKGDDLERRSLRRLKDQCMRLETQLENSLLLAAKNSSKPFIQRIHLQDFIENQKENWRTLELETNSLREIVADSRSLECIFNNAFHNALKHGQNRQVLVRQADLNTHQLIEIETYGQRFSGPRERLGEPFFHFGPTGGSGLGLYLTKKMMLQMGGRAEFVPGDTGFVTRLFFRKSPPKE